MRVALVASRFAPRTGGVETHVDQLARNLVACGVEVDVVTQDPDPALAPTESLAGVTVHRFRLPARAPHELVAPGLVGHLRRHRYDVVHAHNYHALPALAAAVCRSRPLVVTPHFHGGGHSPLRRLAHVPYRRAGRAMLGAATSLICVSQAEAARLAGHFPGVAPATVIPNGVDRDAFTAAEPFATDGPVLLVVSRLEAYKRVDVVVRAAALLPAGVRLVVVGEGAERPRLEDLARSLGCAGRVRFVGRVGDDDLHRWYRTASAQVTMSEHEAFGLTLLEARAAGAAVVASDIAAHREVAAWDPAGIRLCPPTPAAAAAAIGAALASPPPPTTVLPTWSDMARRTREVYEHCVG